MIDVERYLAFAVALGMEPGSVVPREDNGKHEFRLIAQAGLDNPCGGQHTSAFDAEPGDSLRTR